MYFLQQEKKTDSKKQKCFFCAYVTNLEPLDPLLDGVDVGAELQASQLAELGLSLAQPGPHGLEVRDQLLPLLHVVLVPVLVAHRLSLDQLPALDHACEGTVPLMPHVEDFTASGDVRGVFVHVSDPFLARPPWWDC